MSSQSILTPFFLRSMPQTKQYAARLQEEFELIDKFRFTKVFEQVQVIVSMARELQIPHIIRGSAGSSLVCFLMGITHIDPIQYKLELARFMNHGRQDLPDIDIDVPYNRREELYKKIEERWPNAVARISNHVLYSKKVAVRECAKEILSETISPVPALRSSSQKKQLQQVNRKQFSIEKLFPQVDDQDRLLQMANDRTGTLKHYSLHCGGIVIFEEEGEVPKDLLLDTTKPFKQIHLNKDETEMAGFIKIDILSNRGLAQLVEAQASPRHLLDYPKHDILTETMMAKGLNIGLTFGESRGMRKLFLGMKPRHRNDLAILLALIRPAAATQGRKLEFLKRWRDTDKRPADPLLQQIIFDDDAIHLIRLAISCDSAEADRWRKVFAKGNQEGRLQFRRLLFQRGLDRSVVESLLAELDYLALYSFCKSHAVSYAQLLWALAYEKAHNPHRFWMAALNHCQSEYRKWVHYREARCSGLQLTRDPPPYKLIKREGRPALTSIKSQGQQLLLTQMFKTQRSTFQQDCDDMREYGYWLSEDFLPNCGVWPEQQQTLERWFGSDKEKRQVRVKFRGLIATSRILRRDGLVTLFTLGVENLRYIDCIWQHVDRSELFSYTAIEGKGLYEKNGLTETIQVESAKGISLETLRTI